MRKVTRRQALKGLTGLGLCALGREVLAAIGRAATPRPGLEPTPEAHTRESLYYASVQSTSDCQSCHGLVDASSERREPTSHRSQYVKCQLCPRKCVIAESQRGECGVRENRGGKLYTLVYGNPCAVHNAPIEIKPFYHFLPGSRAYSIATAGCNLHCLYCQNWTISQRRPEETENQDLPPEAVVEEALRQGTQSLSFTYSEPTVFYEYMLDCARLGRGRGLYSNVVSNGYINPQPLRELCQAVDAIKVDLKAFTSGFYEKICSGTLEPVLQTLRTIREEGVHLEIVNLVVPTLNDKETEQQEMVRWIVENLGPLVPLHFNRFLPQYRLTALPPTPLETLERARAIAMDEGMPYVYIGNVGAHPAESTYCGRCHRLIIQRHGVLVLANHIVDGKCAFCGAPIPGVWE